MTTIRTLAAILALGLALGACDKKESQTGAGASTGATAKGGAASSAGASKAGDAPVFVLSWSEYPSWSVFGVAHDVGLIDKARGKLGPLEKKHGVDLELKLADYDTCIQQYGSGAADAVCVTNMDALNPALGRPGVAILPTSTSVGGDALVAVGITDVKQLKGKKVYGLAKTVSEFAFVRGLQKLGEDPKLYTLANMAPDAAATAMQTKQPGFEAIMVWNPFILQTLKTRPDAKVLFDSSLIPEEIIDMVVIARASLERPGGPAAAACIADTFYQFNAKLADTSQADALLVKLGENFSSLGLAEVKKVVEATRFYASPATGLALFKGGAFPKTMGMVVAFCKDHEIIDKAPSLHYGAWSTRADLVFDPGFMEALHGAKGN